MSAAGRAALALDEALAALSAADAARLRAEIDTLAHPLTDQIDAASAEAYRALAEGSRSWAGQPIRGARPDEVPDWVRLQALELLAAFAMGTASTCQHDPSPARPEPLQGSAWRPGLIACWRCPHLFRLPKVQDRTCDQCGTVADLVYPSVVLLGPLAFSFGMCPDCHGDWMPEVTSS